MTRDVGQLKASLKKSPEDWSVRLTLVEECIRQDDMSGARGWVRDSPNDAPLPAQLQYRLHTLMTKGKDALESLEPLIPEGHVVAKFVENDGEAEPANVLEISEEKKPERVIEPVPPAKSKLDKEQTHQREPVPPAKSHPEPVPAAKSDPVPVPPAAGPIEGIGTHDEPPQVASKKPNFDEIAPLKDGAFRLHEQKQVEISKAKAAPEIKLEKNEVRSEKWDSYRGNLLLTGTDDIELPELNRRPGRISTAAEKVSAATLAIIVHVIIFVACAAVVIAIPRPQPPKLIASVIHEKELELQTTKLTKTAEKKLSTASMQSVNLISSVAPSAMQIPEIEPTDSTTFTSFIPGVDPTGIGLSMTGVRDMRSDISFFGISGGSDKIVFIVDATRPMLIDEKGGMFAYDKVKSEIGAMLSELRRGTYFNILLYEGGRVVAFSDKLVSGLPSNRRKAIEWLDPLNRTYENLGLRNGYTENVVQVTDMEIEPIKGQDIAHYAKCIQKALEWQAGAIFCISAGYLPINQSPSAEMIEEYKDSPRVPGTPGTIDPAAAKAWREAQQKTREWLQKENAARAEKGLAPKVVLSFNRLVREVTGATPPRASGGTPPSGGIPRLPNHTPEDIEKQVKNLVKKYYEEARKDDPSIHMVLFLGEDEEIGQYEDHFKDLTRKNHGKLKVLRGLSALEDVTSR